MFFTTTTPANFRRQAYSPANQSLERFLTETQLVSRNNLSAMQQDDTSYTLTLDVPGVTKEQLSIGIEGSVIRIETKEGAARQYKQAYELPQDIDISSSAAKLEHGVLTIKLGKQIPVSRVSELSIH
jgi:HSP20 family molecular chaperone IbpA